jgi:hypothetical protein
VHLDNLIGPAYSELSMRFWRVALHAARSKLYPAAAIGSK